MEEEGKGKDSEGKKVCIIVAIATILHFVTSLSSASGMDWGIERELLQFLL